jgi:hypothetical protein
MFALGGMPIVGVGVLAAVLYVRVSVLDLAPIPGAEISETKLLLKNVVGADFEVVETNYDGLSKDDFVSVYAWKTGKRSSWIGSLVDKKELLFRYEPSWNGEESIPAIKAIGPNSIRISVPRVSSIIAEHRNWKQISIEYSISHVDSI